MVTPRTHRGPLQALNTQPRRIPPTWADFDLSKADLAWHDDAACRDTDPDAFFPEPGPGARDAIATARRVCARCPVRQQCRDFADTQGEPFGIWGGATEQERRPARRITHINRSRDREVARLTRAGKTAREIARTLATTPRTVARIRARLRTNQEAA